jgi:hypothetical protein
MQNLLSKEINRLETSVAVQIYNNYLSGKPGVLNRTDYLASMVPHKPSTIPQDNEMADDYKRMKLATKAYAKSPISYTDKRTEYGLPEQFRCNYIIYSKHKYRRCACVISKECGENMYCARHYEKENAHMDAYSKLLEKHISAIDVNSDSSDVELLGSEDESTGSEDEVSESEDESS